MSYEAPPAKCERSDCKREISGVHFTSLMPNVEGQDINRKITAARCTLCKKEWWCIRKLGEVTWQWHWSPHTSDHAQYKWADFWPGQPPT